MRYSFIDSSQYLFNKALLVLCIAMKLFFKLIVYLPLWFVGYMIVTNILGKGDSALGWIGLIALFTLLLYQIVFFIKGIIIGLMNEANFLWIPLFVVCISFTCIFPAWIVYNYIQPILQELSPKSGGGMSWIGAIAFGIYTYSRYHYLTNIAPVAALPSYQLGISIVSKSTNAITGIQYI